LKLSIILRVLSKVKDLPEINVWRFIHFQNATHLCFGLLLVGDGAIIGTRATVYTFNMCYWT